jgi:hypothetical protein
MARQQQQSDAKMMGSMLEAKINADGTLCVLLTKALQTFYFDAGHINSPRLSLRLVKAEILIQAGTNVANRTLLSVRIGSGYGVVNAVDAGDIHVSRQAGAVPLALIGRGLRSATDDQVIDRTGLGYACGSIDSKNSIRLELVATDTSTQDQILLQNCIGASGVVSLVFSFSPV